ncbi:hypothetical protein BVY03_00195 [bacterium K02(2017)]|nr:hypothetical protein BVY03_00195 [bacterium K02(2017)]
MSIGKSGQSEEEYFAQVEIEKKKKLATEVKAKLEDAEMQKLKELHYMRCPKCGLVLHEIVYKGVAIDKCYSCGVIVLDDGELEKLAGEEDSLIKSIVGLFK